MPCLSPFEILFNTKPRFEDPLHGLDLRGKGRKKAVIAIKKIKTWRYKAAQDIQEARENISKIKKDALVYLQHQKN